MCMYCPPKPTFPTDYTLPGSKSSFLELDEMLRQKPGSRLKELADSIGTAYADMTVKLNDELAGSLDFGAVRESKETNSVDAIAAKVNANKAYSEEALADIEHLLEQLARRDEELAGAVQDTVNLRNELGSQVLKTYDREDEIGYLDNQVAELKRKLKKAKKKRR